MTHPFPMRRLLGVALATLAIPASAQSPVSVEGDELAALVTGRTWAFSQYGDPANAAQTNVWDFRKDGSVCARTIGSKRTDKCADEGKWSIKGRMICWELTWMGESLGMKRTCSEVQRVGKDRFELRNEKNPELTFAVVKLL
jgi:hypothetical protein